MRSHILSGLTILALSASLPAHAQVVAAADINQLSLEQLSHVEITSVSGRSQSLSDAPAAVYVISHDDVIRSGATSLAEMLRLAPNLQVAQMSANSYAITARGFNGNAANKLLVLIDGRSVYTTLYGGVIWDEKDVLPENVERIEVISGPGATLWGANAVNGVINIITRKAADRPGGVIDVSGGNKQSRASLQYAGALANDLNYRVYGETFSIAHGKTSTGARAQDGLAKSQGGFRLDWTPAGDSVTLQGDIYGGSENASPIVNTSIYGGNIQASWNHALDNGSSVQVTTYYDATRRYAGPGSGYSLNTYDLEVQHNFSPWEGHDIVWGAGGRIYQDKFILNGALLFLPTSRTQTMGDVFAQDSITLTPSLNLTVGVKMESDPFSGLEALPSARLSWKASDTTLLWAAVSQAVRAPTRFDADIYDTLVPNVFYLVGNKNFVPETVRAYEIGTRLQPVQDLTFSVSGFYNIYNNLRSVEIQQATSPIIWVWGNMMGADTYGVEAWADYAATDWWRLKAGFNLQHEDRRFKPGSAKLGGVQAAGNDPNHQVSLRSSMDLGDALKWDADLRWIGALPNPKVPSYVELNARLAWDVTSALELSLSGLNLLHYHHLEYELAGATTGTEIDRNFSVEAKWRF